MVDGLGVMVVIGLVIGRIGLGIIGLGLVVVVVCLIVIGVGGS